MTTFTATALAGHASPAAVLEVLTDPEAARRWAPVAFRLRGGEDRLVRGNRVQVVSNFAGQSVGFDVDVLEADARRLALTASGPVRVNVSYDVHDAPGGGSRIDARLELSRRSGLLGHMLDQAGRTMLRAGLLERTLQKIAFEAAA